MSNQKRKVEAIDWIPVVKSYLERIDARIVSMLTAAVFEMQGGYGKRVATIRFSREGDVLAPTEFAPTDIEADGIKRAILAHKLPEQMNMKKRPTLPQMLKDADPDNLFEFTDENGEFVMLQSRIESKDGGRAYVPWTYFDDGVWRPMEPEGDLPLWGLDQLKDHSIVYIHEGAKAARYCRWMCTSHELEAREALAAHPWGDELKHGAHVGWIGGALSPERTDWGVLKRKGATMAFIISDNDAVGVSAVPKIAEQLRFPTYHVGFTNQWPGSFDLADEFPERLFRSVDSKRRYIGPTMQECTHPATWATDLSVGKNGRKRVTLRRHFVDEWVYIEELDQWVVQNDPSTLRSDALLNKILRPFSHVANTSQLLQQHYKGRHVAAAYLPGRKVGNWIHKGVASYNLYRPSMIKSVPGDPQPFLEFMEHLLPVSEERQAALRWVATLIARPSTRMHFGLLLISETQGVGKTTLAESILAPLIGEHNVSFPREMDIVDSSFNSWMVRKRLVVVAEIYSGHSKKAYNQLKQVMTDKTIEVNEKYARPFTLDNHVHVLASSNSLRALSIAGDDRRWLVPTVSEMHWPKDKFDSLYRWLDSGSLGIVRHWAEAFNDYVQVGDRPMATSRKDEIIAETMSDHLNLAANLASVMAESGTPTAVAICDVDEWVRQECQDKMFDGKAEIRSIMRKQGVHDTVARFRIKGKTQQALYNAALSALIEVELAGLPPNSPAGSKNAVISNLIREHLVEPRDLADL